MRKVRGTVQTRSDLVEIPGIGRTFARDFARIGIRETRQLMGKNPTKLFTKLVKVNEAVGHATSKNYLYVLRMAVYYADGGREPSKLKWAAWKDGPANLQRFEPKTRSSLRSWLQKNHTNVPGVWLVLRKKGVIPPPIPLEDVLEEMVAHGWVDSRPAKLDATRSLLLCTPRKPTSAWSALNKRRAGRMTNAGLMSEAGRRAISVAKKNGRWNALDAVQRLEVPDDLARALHAQNGATAEFEAFPPSVKRGILEWISQARTASTRAKRIAETATKAARGERANQWPRQKLRSEVFDCDVHDKAIVVTLF